MRILLVEDEEPDALLVRRSLSDAARRLSAVVEVVWVQSLEEASERLKAERWDAAILDLTLGPHRGPVVVETLSPLLAAGAACIVLTEQSAVDLQTWQRPLLTSGADSVFSKETADPFVLLSAIEAAAVRHDLRLQRGPAQVAEAVRSLGQVVRAELVEVRDLLAQALEQVDQARAEMQNMSARVDEIRAALPSDDTDETAQAPPQSSAASGQSRGGVIVALGQTWSSMDTTSRGAAIVAITTILGGLIPLVSTCTGNPAPPVPISAPATMPAGELTPAGQDTAEPAGDGPQGPLPQP